MDIDNLRKQVIFHGFSKSELESLLSLGTEKTFTQNDEILKKDTEGDSFFILLTGSADVLYYGKKLATLEDGSIFGEMCLFNENRRLYDVKATQNCDVVEINSHHFFID